MPAPIQMQYSSYCQVFRYESEIISDLIEKVQDEIALIRDNGRHVVMVVISLKDGEIGGTLTTNVALLTVITGNLSEKVEVDESYED